MILYVYECILYTAGNHHSSIITKKGPSAMTLNPSRLFHLARLWTRRLTGHSQLCCQAVTLFIFCATPAWSTPIILNLPSTAAPGNIVSLEGSGFGSSPRVYFRPFTSASPIPSFGSDAGSTAQRLLSPTRMHRSSGPCFEPASLTAPLVEGLPQSLRDDREIELHRSDRRATSRLFSRP